MCQPYAAINSLCNGLSSHRIGPSLPSVPRASSPFICRRYNYTTLFTSETHLSTRLEHYKTYSAISVLLVELSSQLPQNNWNVRVKNVRDKGMSVFRKRSNAWKVIKAIKIILFIILEQ